MLTISKPLSAAQASTYYREQYAREDYYTERGEVVGRWGGRGGAVLGLAGPATEAEFQALLGGRHPRTGDVLVPAGQASGTHRAGWDLTFSAPKSVSLAALIGGDARLVEAHRRSVDRALAELEAYTQARRRGGHERVTTGNLVVAAFDHETSRAGDPQLHTHVVAFNLTQRPDGAWRALEPAELYRSQAFATAVYRSELALAVQDLGYGLALGSGGKWELAGVTRDQLDRFSRRRDEIDQYLAARGLRGTAAERQIAAHQSRAPKAHDDPARLREAWHERAREGGYDARAQVDEALSRGPRRLAAGLGLAMAREGLAYSLHHTTERTAVPDRREVERHALTRAMGRAALDDVRADLRDRLATGEVLVARHHHGPREAFTTREMLALEEATVRLMRDGRGRMVPVLRTAPATALAEDQAAVARDVLTSADQVVGVEGRAGAGKTTTLASVRGAAAQAGWVVRGFAPTTKAAQQLRESGVLSETVAALLQRDAVPAGRRQLWIVDEAGMLSTRQMYGLLLRAREAEARVVLVGDSRQHRGVEAGHPFAQLQAAGMSTATLEQIRRQIDPELKAAVEEAARGHADRAVARLDRAGAVHEIADREARLSAVARAYVAAPSGTLVVTPANRDRVDLNATIRTELRAAGLVAGEGIAADVLVSRGLTGAERAAAQAYEVGDVVRYGRGSRVHRLAAGDYATVAVVAPRTNTLTVTTRDGRSATYDPRRLRGVEVYRAEPREFAGGDRIQFRAPDRRRHIANGALGTVEHADTRTGRAIVRLDIDGRRITLVLAKTQHLDHGYAVTSYAAQGSTVARTLVHVDTTQSAKLVNREMAYVAISRARVSVAIYTDDRTRLPAAVRRLEERLTAVEAVRAPVGAPEQAFGQGIAR